MPCFETTRIMVLFSEGKLLSISSFISSNLAKRDVLKICITILSPLREITFGRPLFLLRSSDPVFHASAQFCMLMTSCNLLVVNFSK